MEICKKNAEQEDISSGEQVYNIIKERFDHGYTTCKHIFYARAMWFFRIKTGMDDNIIMMMTKAAYLWWWQMPVFVQRRGRRREQRRDQQLQPCWKFVFIVFVIVVFYVFEFAICICVYSFGRCHCLLASDIDILVNIFLWLHNCIGHFVTVKKVWTLSALAIWSDVDISVTSGWTPTTRM